MIKTIIFDLDGLLIDSQPLQYKSYNQVFSKYGYPINLEQWHEWIHGSYNTKSWIEMNDLPLDSEKIRAEKFEIYKELIANELKMKEGAREALDALHGNYRLCLASASRMDTIELILDKFDIKSQFEKAISDFDVEKRKPYPDVFIKVAEKMQVNPNECLVIEDSVAGLKAAKAAGMKCIICPDTFTNLPLSEFTDADKIIGSLRELTPKTIETDE